MSTNLPGFVKPKITTSSMRTSVSSSLSTATRSTTCSSSMTRSGSIFGTNFGVFAQRSSTGLGLHNNYLLYNSGNTSELRHSLNDNRTPLFNNIYYAEPHHHDDSKMNKFMGVMMGLGMAAGIGGMIFNMVQQSKASDIATLNDAQRAGAKGNPNGKLGTEVPGSTSGVSSQALASMKEAKDSTSLRAAIESAGNYQTGLETQLQELEATLPDLKANSEAATKQLEDLKPIVDAKEQEVKQKEKDVSDKTSVMEGAEKDKTSKLNVVKDMENAVGQAATNYTQASEALVAAKAKLASTPKTIMGPDGTPIENPAYQEALNAVKNAEAQKTEAQKALDEARKNHESAVNNYEKSVKAYEDAAQQLQTAKEELEKANAELDKAQEELNALKKQQSDAQAQVKKYEDALEQQKDLEEGIADYKKEIAEQNKRLQGLVKKEAKELEETVTKMNGLADKISDRNEDINSSDGLSFREKNKLRRNERNSDEYARLTEKRNELELKQNYTKLASMPAYTAADGSQLRKAEFGGETLYMIGSRPVTQQEFDAKMSLEANSYL